MFQLSTVDSGLWPGTSINWGTRLQGTNSFICPATPNPNHWPFICQMSGPRTKNPNGSKAPGKGVSSRQKS